MVTMYCYLTGHTYIYYRQTSWVRSLELGIAYRWVPDAWCHFMPLGCFPCISIQKQCSLPRSEHKGGIAGVERSSCATSVLVRGLVGCGGVPSLAVAVPGTRRVCRTICISTWYGSGWGMPCFFRASWVVVGSGFGAAVVHILLTQQRDIIGVFGVHITRSLAQIHIFCWPYFIHSQGWNRLGGWGGGEMHGV